MKLDVKINKDIKELLVEIHTKEINEEVKNLIDKLSSTSHTIITGIHNEKTYILNPKDIISIYGEDKKVFARTKDNSFKLKYRLYEIEDLLKDKNFIRISNSSIINIIYIKNLEALFNGMVSVNFTDGTKEYISRRYLKKIKSYFNM